MPHTLVSFQITATPIPRETRKENSNKNQMTKRKKSLDLTD